MPDTPQSELPLSRFLTYRITLLSQQLNRSGARWHMKNSGLNLAEWRVLATLGFFGDLSPGDIANQTIMDKAVVSRVKTSLLKQGLIHERPDPRDSRKRILGISDEGRALYDQTIPKASARQARLMEQFSADELEALDACIAKMQLFFEREESL